MITYSTYSQEYNKHLKTNRLQIIKREDGLQLTQESFPLEAMASCRLNPPHISFGQKEPILTLSSFHWIKLFANQHFTSAMRLYRDSIEGCFPCLIGK